MKPLPAPHVPGKTEFERFDNAIRRVLGVSKEELLKREAPQKRTWKRKGGPSDRRRDCSGGSLAIPHLQLSLPTRSYLDSGWSHHTVFGNPLRLVELAGARDRAGRVRNLHSGSRYDICNLPLPSLRPLPE